MNKMRIFFLLALVSTFVYACKDKTPDDQNTPVEPKYKSENLVDHQWEITALTATGIGDIWNNSMFVKDCNKDNTYRFKSNNILTTLDTPLKCNSADPDSTSGPYALIDNNTKIYLNISLGGVVVNDTSDITQLDETTMKLNIDYSGIPGQITFKRK
ncbi:MAG: lipocalin family protein [Bacteroidota bacterium]